MYLLPVALYLCYVFTNAQVLRPFLQPFELVHVLAALIAIVGITKLVLRPKTNIVTAIFIIVAFAVLPMVLLNFSMLLVPLQVMVVILASVAMLPMIKKNYIKKELYLFILVIMIVGFIDFYFNEMLYIYNSIYGRERLILGFWHPKEAAISVFTIAIMCLLAFRRKWWLIQIPFFILFLFMDSRNITLLHASICFVLLLAQRVSYLVPILIVAFANFAFVGVLLFSGDALDELSSGRQTHWQTVVVNLIEFRSLAASDTERTFVHYDNYYLGYAAFYGLISLIVLAIGLACVAFHARKLVVHGFPVNAFFVPYCFYFIYDAGLFSTGNFLNYLMLIILFSGVKKDSDSKLYERTPYPSYT